MMARARHLPAALGPIIEASEVRAVICSALPPVV